LKIEKVILQEPNVSKMIKLKIVWICHFTNAEMQFLLPIWHKQNEFAPWITNMLKGFENRDDIEIHVISPHDYLWRSADLKIRNIHYHFIPFGIPFLHKHWPGRLNFDIYTNYYFFRRDVKKKIDKIKPEIINLIGAENSYYSSSISDYQHDYPTLILIQGFISQMRGAIQMTRESKKRIDVEEKILSTFKHYAGEQDSSTYIATYNPDHVFFKLYFPINENLALETSVPGKIFDCMYFGRLEKIKGAEDFIRVIAEIKLKKPDVKACMVGGGNVSYLIEMASGLNCLSNIEFKGFVKTQKELFEYVKASRVFLAPPYFERLSSTIREAMFLKVPIVAYATGGIPYINENDEHIYLVETGNYKEMARKTLILLEDTTLGDKLAEKAFIYGIREYGIKMNCERLFSAYKTILNKTDIS
jgi:glycosyltransferase involved in cell wall biosynthesis